MPAAPDNHDAHNYAERIRERLPQRLQELREPCGLSKYGLAREGGLSRGYIAKRRAVMPGLWWGSISGLRRASADFSEASGVTKFSACSKEPEKHPRLVTGMTSYHKPLP
jgi:hypothetical protein